MSQPRIWVLLGHRTGDNNQLLALAEALGLPFETRSLRFNWLRVLRHMMPGSLLSLERASRQAIAPPWPDLVIGIGWRNVPVARWIKRASSGRTKQVRLGDPRAAARHFDLIITTPQYPVRDGPNVLKLPIGLSRYKQAAVAEPDEAETLGKLPRPHLLFAVGGPAKYWQLGAEDVVAAASHLMNRAKQQGGTLLIVTSPRTPETIKARLRTFAAEQSTAIAIEGRRPRFSVLLSDADEVFVTGDSIAMLSEAVLAGKPVGIVPVVLDERGRRKLEDGSGRHRDIRRFWKSLQKLGLGGTIDQPVRGTIEDPGVTAAAAVRALLGDSVQ